MPGSFRTEAVVLRSIRYGEADRIVHLYSATRGRIGAIAKGSRRPKSRFGGRLEPFFRLNLVLYEGRGDLFTVTGASTIDGHAKLRSSGLALGAGFSPELASCASCGEAEHLAAFSGAAGVVVCASCEGGGFPLTEEAHRFMVEALARPLSDAPAAEQGVAAQADRAITETLEHHAHVHLRAAA